MKKEKLRCHFRDCNGKVEYLAYRSKYYPDMGRSAILDPMFVCEKHAREHFKTHRILSFERIRMMDKHQIERLVSLNSLEFNALSYRVFRNRIWKIWNGVIE